MSLDLGGDTDEKDKEIYFLKNQVAAYERVITIMSLDKKDNTLIIIRNIIRTHPHLVVNTIDNTQETAEEKSLRLKEDVKEKRMEIVTAVIAAGTYETVNKIDIIKQVKDIMGWGLKEAKDWTDAKFEEHGLRPMDRVGTIGLANTTASWMEDTLRPNRI